MYYDDLKIDVLKGKTLTLISGLELNSERVEFECSDGKKFIMYHSQDCCESVSVEDICGDLQDLLGAEILLAEESTSNENPEGAKVPEYQDSFTWTFYKISTIKGSVTIRWYGESNGYYGERVCFSEITPGEDAP